MATGGWKEGEDAIWFLVRADVVSLPFTGTL